MLKLKEKNDQETNLEKSINNLKDIHKQTPYHNIYNNNNNVTKKDSIKAERKVLFQ